jgi:hypothetical protein
VTEREPAGSIQRLIKCSAPPPAPLVAGRLLRDAAARDVLPSHPDLSIYHVSMAHPSDGRRLPPRKPGLLDRAKHGLQIIEIITGSIAAVSTVIGLIKAAGGPLAVLMAIGVVGLAAYAGASAAFFLFEFLIGPVDSYTRRKLKRETTDIALMWILGAFWLAVTVSFVWLIGLPDPDDYDGLGQTAFAALGVVVLLIPLALLWYAKGSKPTEPPASPHRGLSLGPRRRPGRRL